eukprot:TRINITY_DN365_c0_g1_i1.p1 TRINITY_DN365_c0_g1~~TRINITY_DN365_c0_g1_i1.p1  ORF type:complete len:2213 (-),score=948.81 TRINITY_DN365_c0_g1_i1:73-6711(-)
MTSVKDYVVKHGGNRVIETILIANNGIAAVKAIRSLRKFAYETFGSEKALQFIVMATPEDLKANAEFIRMADQIAEVPGGRNANNYANVDLIVEIAERMGVHGVWAGWGHASENPRLPESLSKTNIAFLGPPSTAMRDLGDKIASTLVAQSANVSCVPWNGTGITVNYLEDGISEDIYKKSTVRSVEEAKEVIARIGFPVMVKASEGGGGKGIRKVISEADIETAYRQVQGEVPGSPIFIMKMLFKCRHLEVQVLADQYNNAIALYGRDCSVQRRHQKIIEEGPPIIAPDDVWIQMENAATRMTKTVGYVGVGTVEYLFEEETNKYYFLELNPRLQVEHPVTELITDVNLVAAQLHVAMGIPLHRIPDIRRLYGQDPKGINSIDFEVTKRIPPKGHVIAARITAENPAEGFKPTSGGIQELTFLSGAKVWGYFSVGALGGLHEFADSQFGHVFAHGDTREDTRKELAIALKELSIRGEISTPVGYVCQLLETEVFKKNQANTQWLDSLIAAKTGIEQLLDPWLVVVCGAVYTAYTKSAERMSSYVAILERGQIPPRDLIKIDDEIDLIYLNTKYAIVSSKAGPQTFAIKLKGKSGVVLADVRPMGDKGLFIFVDGKSHVCFGSDTPTGLKIQLDGKTCQFSTEYDPTQLRSTTAGKLVRYLVENGAHLDANTPYAEMEVMKMYLPMLATEPGVLTYVKNEGSVIQAGDIVATVQLDDPKKVRRAVVCEGDFPEMKPPYKKGEKLHQLLRDSVKEANSVLTGYSYPDVPTVVNSLLKYLNDPELPVLEIQECLSQLKGRLPKEVEDQIEVAIQSYRSNTSQPLGRNIISIIEKFQETLPVPKKSEFLLVVDHILVLARKFEQGLARQAEDLILNLLKQYLQVETFYNNKSRENIIAALRENFPGNPRQIFDIELSHANVSQKNRLIVRLLDGLVAMGTDSKLGTLGISESFLPTLRELSALYSDHYRVVMKSKKILMKSERPSYIQRYNTMEKELDKGSLDALIEEPGPVFDIMTAFFYHPTPSIRDTAIQAYVKRAYKAYDVQRFRVSQIQLEKTEVVMATWMYAPVGYKWEMGSPIDKSRQDLPMSKRVMTDDNLVQLEMSALHNSGERIMSPRDITLGSTEERNLGIMARFSSRGQVFENFDNLLAHCLSGEDPLLAGTFKAALKIVYPEPQEVEDQQIASSWAEFLQSKIESLKKVSVKRVTTVCTRDGKFPRNFTFRSRLNFEEDTIYRHVEPPMAYHLELRRLSNFDVQLFPTENQQIHLYYAQEKSSAKTPRSPLRSSTSGQRPSSFFARAMIRGGHYHFTEKNKKEGDTSASDIEGLIEQAETVLGEACTALEIASADPRFEHVWNNHIFIKFIPEIAWDQKAVIPIITNMARKYERRLRVLKVGTVELVGKLAGISHPFARFFVTNPTTFNFNIDAYAEVKDPKTKKIHLSALFGSRALDGREISDPYPVPSPVERKRRMAQEQLTSYVYDFIPLIETGVLNAWKSWEVEAKKANVNFKLPSWGVEAKELVLNSQGELEETSRPAGQNDIGMIAWKIRINTPECPSSRTFILIANDITFQIGSFGVAEDILFKKASELARKEKIPRIYFAANSGARIGLAQEVKDVFQVEFNDPSRPEKGFKYLYVSKSEFENLSKTQSINAVQISEDKYMITDIIGCQGDLGVENLKGSGMIAGETSQAYNEIFTLTMVTGRTVGIGAYLVRLGHRTIQNKGPIILTGAQALNKVLGRKVYSSNVQLGGSQIMYSNGISHLSVNDELEGIESMLKWLSYVPAKMGEPVPRLPTTDPIDRKIDFMPSRSPYDPRHMLAGHVDASGNWISGFFDKGSFTEVLGGWGKTVITGRGRLGGIPMGIIAVETRTVQKVVPADPAFSDSREDVKQQAGNVWFPDSAYKTAQAISDFNREQLPLIIFANWRGFSGGLRDLFDEILKYGSYIVDNLREYKQPVFIYIPPFGELRGGAWVVVDPTINLDFMEMYCDVNGRGGVLEPSGVVEIKFKEPDVIRMIHRLDQTIKELDAKVGNNEQETAQIREAIVARENELKTVYEQLAMAFADLHDTAGRMKAKDVIRSALNWTTSRQFFYHRLVRRLAQESIKLKIQVEAGVKDVTTVKVEQHVKSWIQEEGSQVELASSSWDDDQRVENWLKTHEEFVSKKIQELKALQIRDTVSELAAQDLTAAMEGILKTLSGIQLDKLPAPLQKFRDLLK